jgi:hypothetical protein
MKTFKAFFTQREMASYDEDQPISSMDSSDPKSVEASKIAMLGIKKIMKTHPEILIAFLNQQRMDPEIRSILADFRLDSFPEIRTKPNASYNDKGLGDRNGSEDGLYPNAADGFSV